jgi:hypothetical protein
MAHLLTGFKTGAIISYLPPFAHAAAGAVYASRLLAVAAEAVVVASWRPLTRVCVRA